VTLFGIRHHGPGCARALVAALDAMRPDCVLVEGPPDAADVVGLAASPAMIPPVALLVYPLDAPGRAVFYPFAEHSPEWQALRWAASNGVPLRFMDLPLAHRLEEAAPDAPDDEVTSDPLGVLASAAGWDDRELWWEHLVEQRLDATDLFVGILEAMSALRPDPIATRTVAEARREAFMRRTIRQAQKDGFERIAVICGAWHAPALAAEVTAKADDAVLKGLPKVKTAATWIPWTRSRLSFRSGYGAGVPSPGWYQFLWEARGDASQRWMIEAARLLRGDDLDASSASVIEAIRLAEALAAMRALPRPGLRELREAALAVLCGGEPSRLRVIHDRLDIGEAMGEVPPDAPAVPLQRDLEDQQKALRMKPSAERKLVDLDLRKDGDRARSHLLHRLQLLGVPWGKPAEIAGKLGTFHEPWWVEWSPSLVVALIERSPYGHTIAAAATALAVERAGSAAELAELTVLLDVVLLADLGDAVPRVLAAVQARSAASADVLGLAQALPPLARVARYGDVRGTDASAVLPVYEGIFERVVVGLPGACASLDDDAAAAMLDAIAGVAGCVATLDREDDRREWSAVLTELAGKGSIHGLVRGYSTRRLFEARALDADGLHTAARLALSPAEPPLAVAAWIEGLLRGSALLLLHQDPVWIALDAWLAELAPDAFTELLPLLRRAFSSFEAQERQAMGAKLGRLGAATPTPEVAERVDPARAARVLPVLRRLLGTMA
jgi:hypothetical protein